MFAVLDTVAPKKSDHQVAVVLGIKSGIEVVNWLNERFFKVVVVLENDVEPRLLNSGIQIVPTRLFSCEREGEGMTFKQMLYETVTRRYESMGFVHCDLEGREDTFCEELFEYVYEPRLPLCVTWHPERWTKPELFDRCAQTLFPYFDFVDTKDGTTVTDPAGFIRAHPTGCTLLMTRSKEKKSCSLRKQNVSALIIAYNLVTYVRMMVNQLKQYTNDIIVVDNCSTFPPLLEFYQNEFKGSLLRRVRNEGHWVAGSPPIQSVLPRWYILTDPDIKLPPTMPPNWVDTWQKIAERDNVYKIGCALDCTGAMIRTDVLHMGKTITQWEAAFWATKVTEEENKEEEEEGKNHNVIYAAMIDTTFCLMNRGSTDIKKQYRMAGACTAKHLPWYWGWNEQLMPGEYDAYIRNNVASSWINRRKKQIQ